MMQTVAVWQPVEAGECEVAAGVRRIALHEPGEGGLERLDLLGAEAGDVLALASSGRASHQRGLRGLGSRRSQRVPIDDPVLEGLRSGAAPFAGRIRRHLGVGRSGVRENGERVSLDAVIGSKLDSLRAHVVNVHRPEEEPDVRHICW
jgi:hypothetical protein